MNDHTITTESTLCQWVHTAQCTCGWRVTSEAADTIEDLVTEHLTGRDQE